LAVPWAPSGHGEESQGPGRLRPATRPRVPPPGEPGGRSHRRGTPGRWEPRPRSRRRALAPPDPRPAGCEAGPPSPACVAAPRPEAGCRVGWGLKSTTYAGTLSIVMQRPRLTRLRIDRTRAGQDRALNRRKRKWMRAFAVILSVCGVFAMVGAVSAAADSSIGVVDEYIPPGSGPTGGNQGGGGAPPGTPGGTSGGSGGGVLAPISGSPSGSSNATRMAIGPSARGARAGFLPFTG